MTNAPFDLSGKVALVTGGNGGIGLGMAEAMARAGANIVGAYHSHHEGAELVRRQIEETMRTEPQRYAALRERVDGLTPRIDGMLTRVDSALGQQRNFLQDIAVEELQAQKDRLDIYMIQARFALAAIYDIAATSGGEASE